MKTENLHICENFLEEDLYNACFQYSIQTLTSTDSSFRTNHSWNSDVVNDSNVVLVHTLNSTNILYALINDTVKTKFKTTSIKSIFFYYWMQGSHIPWHDDGGHAGAITIYLNGEWNENWGGAFLYKDTGNDTITGIYPKQNRAIQLTRPLQHTVVPTTKNSDVRFTIQIFV